MHIKKYIYISTAVLGMLAGAVTLQSSHADAAQNNIKTETVQPNNDANAEKRMTKPGMLGMTKHIARKDNHKDSISAHLNYHHGYVTPTPGNSDDITAGFGAPAVDGHYHNYMNGRYNIWSRPGYYNRKHHYVPRGVMITDRVGSIKLALQETPFKAVKSINGHMIMKIVSKDFVGWIPQDGLYLYYGNEGKLPIHYPSQHISRRVKKSMKRINKNMRMRKNWHPTRRNHRMNMKDMNMSGNMLMHGTPAPQSLKVAKHPRFRRGAKVIVKADHMPGTKNAKAKIVGVYNTRLYEVDYLSTKTHQVVRNHKWVVAPEIKTDHKGDLKVGERVQLKANHMKDMYNAAAKIVGIHNGPAYMINYRPTNNQMIMVTNHKWLTQDELAR